MNMDFVYIDEYVPGVRWDAKYATWDNFTGAPVEGYEANRIVGTRHLAGAIKDVKINAQRFGFGLLLWDAYRPKRAVDSFMKWVKECSNDKEKEKHYPNIDRKSMIDKGYIAEKSGHSRGSAVDLTLYRLDTGELLEMGGGFDLMDTSSHHDAEGISPAEAKNRKLLKFLMEDSGFKPYEFEWWHYLLENEPYPDTYFDFPITSV